ncbi:hypothetical protein HA466_0299430 [Hirschfeldia incana]|nr:hypothetical protein HA466_0299430 [Hirschfeldia incana]
MMTTPVRKSIAIIRSVEFYGNALPRPHFNSHRTDPPLPVLDPLLSSCARDAHWSTRGRNEGNLRAQLGNSSPGDSEKKRSSGCDSPPTAPVAVKRRRYLDLNDNEEEEEEDKGVAARIIRNLSDDFERVAGESKIIKKSIESAGKRLKAKNKKKKKTLRVEETSSTRITSPRLTKSLCFR